jgi:hypothetical protein
VSRANMLGLEDLITGLAASAIDIQRLWNIAPPLVLRKWECDATISVTASRQNGFSVQAQAVNLGFAIAHHRTYKTASKISVTIEQIPPGGSNHAA